MTWILHTDIGNSIKDEFTEKPISRQRKHQMRNKEYFSELKKQERIKEKLVPNYID